MVALCLPSSALLLPGNREGSEESERLELYRDRVLAGHEKAAFAGGVLDAENRPAPGTMVCTIDGAEHQNFCDVSFWATVRV